MWRNVQDIDQNGVIVMYEVLNVTLNQLNGVLAQGIVSVSASNKSIVLKRLKNMNINYIQSVQAHSSAHI